MTDIATTDHGALSVPNHNKGVFADLIDGATVIQSATLEQDKMSLIGVPMVITRVTYRPRAAKMERGYVSVEAVIGDVPHILQAVTRGWIPGVERIVDFPFSPEELIVFNDGSTGIRRQLTFLLHGAGELNIGKYKETSRVGVDSAFDRDWSQWESFKTATIQKVNDAEIEIPDFQGLQIFAPHGLRVSEYTADGVGDATTFYLA